jgi:hypothetical protein
MARLRGFCGVLLFSGAVAVACSFAQEKTDPKPDTKGIPRGYRMYLVADARFGQPEFATSLIDPKRDLPADERNRVGKIHDPVTEYGLFSVLGVWSRTVPTTKDDPTVKVVERVEMLANKYQAKRLGGFVAYLCLKKNFEDDDDRDKRMAEVANLAKGLKLMQSGVAEQESAQNAAWGLDAKNEDGTFKNQITVVLFHRFKVVHRWDFPADKPPVDADLDKISAAVDDLLGRKSSAITKDGPKKETPKDEPKKQ